MIKRQVERYGKAVALIFSIAVVALASAAYILSQERLKSPFATSYTINAAFPSVAGVAPGLGLPVNVSGVQVGQITGAELKDGAGVLHMAIDPKKLPHVYANARAVLVPNSPLKDMQVNINPGSGTALKSGDTIPVGQTTSPIDSDDLLDALDTDTRDWLVTLIDGLDQGTNGRAPDLNTLFKVLGPTAEQTQQVAHVLAARRKQVARLVSNLSILTQAVGTKDKEIGTVVEAGNQTLAALAGQDAALRSSVAQLPGTLSTLKSTLGNTTTLANALRPTLTKLEPTVKRFAPTLKNARPLLQGGGLLPTTQLRAFTNGVLPLANQLQPATKALNAARAPLTQGFNLLTYFTNELAYDPPGKNPGFLYWLPWFAHNFNSVFSTGDANGATTRGLLFLNCSALTDNPAQGAISTVLGATGLCTMPAGNG